jgi:hypothetical protein
MDVTRQLSPVGDLHGFDPCDSRRQAELPNRLRMVRSEGAMWAAVQLSSVGKDRCSATNLRTASISSSILSSARSHNGTASPSNTPGGFVLWELRSTATTSGIHQGQRRRVGSGACFGNASCGGSDLTAHCVTCGPVWGRFGTR